MRAFARPFWVLSVFFVPATVAYTVIGVRVTGISLVGWVYEYYRGVFAR